MAIKTYKDKATEDIACERKSKRALKRLPKPLQKVAYRRLVFLDNASSLMDLKAWKSNHFERLKRDRKGDYSIRINDKYRICFKWADNNAYDVEVVDYH
jgi:proteic killer suppression protein